MLQSFLLDIIAGNHLCLHIQMRIFLNNFIFVVPFIVSKRSIHYLDFPVHRCVHVCVCVHVYACWIFSNITHIHPPRPFSIDDHLLHFYWLLNSFDRPLTAVFVLIAPTISFNQLTLSTLNCNETAWQIHIDDEKIWWGNPTRMDTFVKE